MPYMSAVSVVVRRCQLNPEELGQVERLTPKSTTRLDRTSQHIFPFFVGTSRSIESRKTYITLSPSARSIQRERGEKREDDE